MTTRSGGMDVALEPLVGRGDVVTVRKGAQVRSLHPQRGRYVAQRSQKVKVHLATRGFVLDGIEYPAEISWAGSGGYWCYVALDDVTPNAQVKGAPRSGVGP